MKILRCTASNFGSYKDLSFDFSETGLALVYGATGSGKSTLQDLVPWILFGVTAKDGNVDEIRSWKAGDLATVGTLAIKFDTCTLHVTRTRGSTKENDLKWAWSGDDVPDGICRGKDLADSQKCLNGLLGVDAEAYNTAATFNEFSDTGLFFLAKSKDKRLVFEKVANLDFPAQIAAATADARKTAKKALDAAQNVVTRHKARLDSLKATLASTLIYHNSWEKDKRATISRLEVKYKGFEKEKESNVAALETKSYRFEEERNKKIDELIDKLDSVDQKIKNAGGLTKKEAEARAMLPPHCLSCGRVNNTSEKLERIKADIEANNQNMKKFSEYSSKLEDLQRSLNSYKDQLAGAIKVKNHYAEQLAEKAKEISPFTQQIADLEKSVPVAEYDLLSQIEICNTLKTKHSALDQLHALSFELRGVLLKNVVKLIQNNTNSYLEKYFDAEFKVTFELADADSLEVVIQKNGYPCVFKQLSKGQRQMLKLCFAVSIMKAAANSIGVSFNLLTFDEALDGLDADLKVKAFGLFESLSIDYSSVLVIDHTPEFQRLFDNVYKVALIADESTIERE